MAKIQQKEVIEALGGKLGITMSESERFIIALKDFIYERLAAGNRVNLQGFGQFSVSHRKSRLGVNPRNPGQKITLPELNTPKFKAGEAFKEAVKLRK